MRTISSALRLICLVLLVGCTPLTYGPIGGPDNPAYGYKDGHAEDGRASILVVTPATSKPDLANEFWERRARELCGERYSKNIYRAVRATQLYNYYGGRPGDYYLEGYVTCESQ